MISLICKDPFRLFFPIAAFAIFYASGLWISFGIFEFGEFPLQEHVNLFIGIFLYFSILGFLLTAIPRFTSTFFLSKIELSFFTLVILGTLFSYFTGNQTLFWFSIFCGWPLLLQFGMRRFIRRKQNPPFTFVFVGLGVILGLLGSLFLFLSHLSTFASYNLERWGKLLFYDVMVTSFIIGVGGRLIPGILGFKEIVNNQRQIYESPKPFLKVIPTEIIISLFVFMLSIILEGIEYDSYAYILRATVITFFSFKYWRIHKPVKTQKWHGRMLKLSCFFLLITSWALVLFLEDAIHIKHLIYIGTYLLMTLMIASRVILAHGESSLEFENKKFPYLVIGLLVALAASTRASAYLLEDSYVKHLGYAGLVLFFAISVWSKSFFAKIFIFHKQE